MKIVDREDDSNTRGEVGFSMSEAPGEPSTPIHPYELGMDDPRDWTEREYLQYGYWMSHAAAAIHDQAEPKCPSLSFIDDLAKEGMGPNRRRFTRFVKAAYGSFPKYYQKLGLEFREDGHFNDYTTADQIWYAHRLHMELGEMPKVRNFLDREKEWDEVTVYIMGNRPDLYSAGDLVTQIGYVNTMLWIDQAPFDRFGALFMRDNNGRKPTQRDVLELSKRNLCPSTSVFPDRIASNTAYKAGLDSHFRQLLREQRLANNALNRRIRLGELPRVGRQVFEHDPVGFSLRYRLACSLSADPHKQVYELTEAATLPISRGYLEETSKIVDVAPRDILQHAIDNDFMQPLATAEYETPGHFEI